MLREGSYLQSRYEIIGCIGSGGMSDVYKARDRKLNRLVGIKVLKKEFGADHDFVVKFRMEAQSAAGLTHPNVVNVYDVVDDGDLHYIVMELVEGITLKNFILSKGRLDLMEATGIAIQVAEGIGAAHAQKIVHRDIKPQNIIISSDGKAKVADFGIARAVSTETVGITAMGSVHYISPEQAKGEPSDERSDIYSLGITMYEMVTGKLPFNGDNSVTVAIAQIENDMPLASASNPAVTAAFDQIIQKCCQKKPERRYQNVNDLIDDLRRILVVPNMTVPVKSQNVGSETRILTEQEVGEINARAKVRANSEKINFGKAGSGKKNAVKNGKSAKDELELDDDDATDGRFDKVIAVLGIIVAVLIVGAVVFGILKLSGTLGSGSQDGSSIEQLVNPSLINDTQTYVPDVVGLDYELATQKLKDSGLGIEVSGNENSDTVEKDTIISQSPEPNSVVDKYSKISVVVSLGSNGESLSDYLYQSYESVREELLAKGYEVSMVEGFSEEHPSGVVIDINPIRPEKNATVTLTVSKGSETDITKVPSIIGLTEDEAIAVLAESGLTPGTVDEIESDTVPAGSVVSQSIAAETEISRGTPIGYTLSKSNDADAKYVGSIRDSYQVQNLVGPGSDDMEFYIGIRLHQIVDGEDVYTTLMEPRYIEGSTLLPVKFDYIEGAYGVDQGEVEVYKEDTDEILKSYTVEFFKQQ